MRWGFKTWAEKETLRLRQKLGIRATERLPARILAADLGVIVQDPQQIPGMTPELLATLLRDGSGWSAVTLPAVEPVIVIHNPLHSLPRQESDLMHEIAHLLCRHQCGGVTLLGALPCRTFDPEQEEEAEWLGACLQIPRDGLLWCLKQGWDTVAIAEHFGASVKQAQHRRNRTGVDSQLSRARARWRR
jgi:hypothetical protein